MEHVLTFSLVNAVSQIAESMVVAINGNVLAVTETARDARCSATLNSSLE
jgi:hypothetical protein